MLAIERRKDILAKLYEHGKVVVSELSAAYNVTEETIRRDLEKLEADGIAKKTYGGAILGESLDAGVQYGGRRRADTVTEQIIGRLIGGMISDGDSIFLDGSPVSLQAARSIKNRKNLTVITSSVEVLLELSDRKGWKIYSTGGMLRGGSLSLSGYQAASMIASINVDMAFFSVGGIDISRGMTELSEGDAQVKRVLLKSGKKKILAVDSAKFNKISFINVGNLNEIDMIVTDMRPSEEWMKELAACGVEVIFPAG